ncbi:hypothetical protein [Roseixanthobacter glucoisosaccharinicivorans]|uniref:hypothetical protein n=1 Tax=Roseixanthobacter glucoisosaccharinicivorans TaxID=3119923 RepID=UPI003726C85B
MNQSSADLFRAHGGITRRDGLCHRSATTYQPAAPPSRKDRSDAIYPLVDVQEAVLAGVEDLPGTGSVDASKHDANSG